MWVSNSPRSVRRFNRTLRRSYPNVRVRWSEFQVCWIVELKANYRRLDLNPAKYPVDAIDTLIALRDGYFIDSYYEPRDLPPVGHFVRYLQMMDTHRMQLDAEQLGDAFDARDIDRIAAKARARQTKLEGMTSDLYDRGMHEFGHRVFVPSQPNN